jgi:2-keto-3-deoxy-L-rhamnonate aldolase RhmA
MSQCPSFRARLRDHSCLAGIFYKSAGYQGIEVLGQTGLDYLVIDAEHAPFSASQLDSCLLAARASGIPALVRVPDDHPSTVLKMLDMGATGVMLPHVSSAEQALRAVQSARYAQGSRGFSNSTRAGAYGELPIQAHLVSSDQDTTVVCQIEDRQAVERIDEIAAVKGVDGLFIGRADLAVSYGCNDVDHPDIRAAVARVAAAGARAGVAVGIFVSNVSEIQKFTELGMTFFLIGSDQSALKTAVRGIVGSFQQATGRVA